MTQPVSLEAFGISKEFGYMQHSDPVTSLSAANGAWDEMARNLPKYLMGSDFRSRVKSLPPFKMDALPINGQKTMQPM
ncbi:MAG: hypothetical protein RLZZ448_636 [Actinomycetota bacterium]